MNKKKIFISHSQDNFGPTDYAIRIIDAIGCNPVIAEKQPKLSRTVANLVIDTLENCDAVLVIATPGLQDKGGKWAPSRGVLEELGIIKESEKFKNKFFVVKETTVDLGAMSDIAYYKFSDNDFAPIAEAILIELGSMGIFKNYYELRGSELQFHEFIDSLHSLKEMNVKGNIESTLFESAVKDLINQAVNKIIGK